MSRTEYRDTDGEIVAEFDGEELIVYGPMSTKVTAKTQSSQGWVGLEMIDSFYRTWTLQDRIIHVDGVSYNWGVADDYLMWDDVAYHRNGTGYIHEILDEDGNFISWSQPGPDPRVNGGNGGNGGTGEVMDTLQTKGSLSGTTLTVQSSQGFKEGDSVIVPATQGRGKKGPGGNYPARVYATETAMRSNIANVPEMGICGVSDTGFTWFKQGGQLKRVIDNGSWYVGYICPKAYFATILKIEGTKWTMSKPAAIPVDDVDVFYDGSYTVMNAIGRDGQVNANKLFPGWKKVAINGTLGSSGRHDSILTCDKPGSFEFFSPPGTPCMSLHWRSCVAQLSNYITLRGNWGDDNYGLNWESSTMFYGYHGMLTDNNPFTPAWLTSGHEFWQSTNCTHEQAKVYNVPNRATGGEGNDNCWSSRIVDYAEFVMRQYIQWQMQYASTVKKCGLIDCEIYSKALIPGMEIMHGLGDLTRPQGTNFMMSMNNASGIVDNPNVVLEKDCIKPLEGTPAWYQYATGNGFGVPWLNLNANAGNWAVDQGITLINPKLDQSAGFLDSRGCQLVGVSVQEKMVKFELRGATFLFPAKRATTEYKYSCGAVGIQCDAPQAKIGGAIKVTGECVNQANNWNVYVKNGVKQSGVAFDVPKGGVYFNGQIS